MSGTLVPGKTDSRLSHHAREFYPASYYSWIKSSNQCDSDAGHASGQETVWESTLNKTAAGEAHNVVTDSRLSCNAREFYPASFNREQYSGAKSILEPGNEYLSELTASSSEPTESTADALECIKRTVESSTPSNCDSSWLAFHDLEVRFSMLNLRTPRREVTSHQPSEGPSNIPVVNDVTDIAEPQKSVRTPLRGARSLSNLPENVFEQLTKGRLKRSPRAGEPTVQSLRSLPLETSALKVDYGRRTRIQAADRALKAITGVGIACRLDARVGKSSLPSAKIGCLLGGHMQAEDIDCISGVSILDSSDDSKCFVLTSQVAQPPRGRKKMYIKPSDANRKFSKLKRSVLASRKLSMSTTASCNAVAPDEQNDSTASTTNDLVSSNSTSANGECQQPRVLGSDLVTLSHISVNQDLRLYEKLLKNSDTPQLTEVDQLVREMLSGLKFLQQRLFLQSELKARMRPRLIYGLKESLKYLDVSHKLCQRIRRVQMLVVARDIERGPVLDDLVDKVLQCASHNKIPVICALTRKRLAQLSKKPSRVACVGILDPAGLCGQFLRLEDIASSYGLYEKSCQS